MNDYQKFCDAVYQHIATNLGIPESLWEELKKTPNIVFVNVFDPLAPTLDGEPWTPPPPEPILCAIVYRFSKN